MLPGPSPGKQFKERLRSGRVSHPPNVGTAYEQFLAERVAGLVAVVEAIWQVDEAQVRQDGHGACQVGLVGFPGHEGKAEDLYESSESRVRAYRPLEKLQTLP